MRGRGGGQVLGESAYFPARAEEWEQNKDSNNILVTLADNVLESEMASEEGKSSYQGRYAMLEL